MMVLRNEFAKARKRLKMLAFNINGAISQLENSTITRFLLDYDILCFSELKTTYASFRPYIRRILSASSP